MANLPGQQRLDTPALPNTAPAPPSAELAKWLSSVNARMTFKPVPPNLDSLLRQHPEYILWAAGSYVGSLRFEQ